MKNILLILPYGGIGGMEKLAENLYTFYTKQGHVVKVVKIVQLPTDVVHFGEDEIAFSQVDLSAMSSLKRYLFYAQIPFLLRRYIHQYKITHSIAFGDFTNLFSSVTFTKEFKIGSIHSLKSVELQTNNFFSKLTRRGFRSSYRHFDRLICISESIKKDLVENCDYRFTDNLSVMYNPHDIIKYTQLADEPLKNEWLPIFENPTYVFVGRISYPKALWHLIPSFSELKKTVHNAQLVLVGDGVEEIKNYMQRQIEAFNLQTSVHWLGMQANPYPIIKASDVVVLSSYYEGTPNILVEAIALNKPIVSTQCTEGIFEMMSVDAASVSKSVEIIATESGYIVPSFFEGDLSMPQKVEISTKHQVFASAMSRALKATDLHEKLKINRASLLAKYDLKTIANQYLSK